MAGSARRCWVTFDASRVPRPRVMVGDPCDLGNGDYQFIAFGIATRWSDPVAEIGFNLYNSWFARLLDRHARRKWARDYKKQEARKANA